MLNSISNKKIAQINCVKGLLKKLKCLKLKSHKKICAKVVTNNSRAHHFVCIVNKFILITQMMESNGLCVKFVKNGFTLNVHNSRSSKTPIRRTNV